MVRNATFELKSGCPIEVVYGLSNSSLKAIKAGHQDAEGYDWCTILDNNSDCREVFLSGVDTDDAELIITDEHGVVVRYRFMAEITCEEDEDLSDVIQFDDSAYTDAGDDLEEEIIDWVVVTRLDLKHRSWKAAMTIDGIFEKSNVKVELKNRDSELSVAPDVYQWSSTYESSVVALYYCGEEVPFEVDYTSYPPEFFCLKRTSEGWSRDEKLEEFFTG
jgi:hypothetical protein